MEVLEIKKSQKSAKFYCELCEYECCKKCDWERHNKTKKHIYRANGSILEGAGSIFSKNAGKRADFLCHCGQSYLTHSGLWKHKKSCQKKAPKSDINSEEKMDVYDLVKYLMKENSELKTILIDQSNKMFDQSNKMGDVTMELVKNGVNNTTNNTTHTNSHNKAFNLNFFLNETCKNAMNITDFVDSIKLQLSDLMDIGELGYIEGISNIIVKNLNNLDETERPIHCTDKKRETFYIKDADKWEKDDERKKMKNTIKKVANKNIRLLSQFKEKYPDYNDSDSIHSDQYSKIVIESMSCDVEKDEKIIRNISKVTGIKRNE